MHHYDLVILGCGAAGEKAAAQAAYYGKKVAVVERDRIGGACVHTGTLPSKGLRESAVALRNLARLGLRGVHTDLAADVRVDELLARKEQVVAAETLRMTENLRRHQVDLYRGQGSFTGPHTIHVQPSAGGHPVELHGDFVIIATGTSPHRPTDIPFDQERVWDSDEVVTMDAIPRSLLVYGAGVIGCEYATMFATLGVEVTLVEPRDRILPFVDRDVTAELLESFREVGIRVVAGARYTGCRVDEAGVTLTLADGRTARAERLLYAAGRSGNTQGLGLDVIGLSANPRGLIDVDLQYRTAVPHVFAVGDVIGFPALASTSMDQGRVAVCHAFSFTYKQSLGQHLPYGIYTIPECAMVGATEQELEEAGIAYEVGRADYRENARAQLVGASGGLLKLVFDPRDHKILGVHVVGERASELVHIGMTAMQLNGTIDTFIEAVYNYPTLSELFKYAAYDGLQRLERKS